MKSKNLFCNVFSLLILSSSVFQPCFAQQGAKRVELKPPQSAENVLPRDIPAGKQFTAWLGAFNSGKSEILQQFIAANFEPSPSAPLSVERMTNRQFGLYKKNSIAFKLREWLTQEQTINQ